MPSPMFAPAGPVAVLWQRVEGAAVLAAALVLFWHWNDTVPWWGALLVFFAPDLSFLAYLFGPKVGAFVYNAVHLYAVGPVLIAVGVVGAIPVLAICGALWLGHCGFDRMLGYGLKSPTGFSDTHLGPIGKQTRT